MKNLLRILAATLPLAALAAPANPPPGGPPADATARMERMHKRMRMTRMLGLAEALDLNEAQVLKMQEALDKIDAKRKPLWQAMQESAQLLQRVAKGDQAAQSQVDQAVSRIFDSRAQLHQLDRDTYQVVTQGLPPQKRARAAIFLAHLGMRMQGGMPDRDGMMMQGGGRGPGGMGMGAMGPGHMMGPGQPGECPCAEGQGGPPGSP